MNNISLSIIGSGYIARKVLKELSSLCQIVSIILFSSLNTGVNLKCIISPKYTLYVSDRLIK